MKPIIILAAILAILFLYAQAHDSRKSVQHSPAPYKYYKILRAGTANDLHILVSAEMGNGWQPAGGIGFAESNYMQALVK